MAGEPAERDEPEPTTASESVELEPNGGEWDPVAEGDRESGRLDGAAANDDLGVRNDDAEERS